MTIPLKAKPHIYPARNNRYEAEPISIIESVENPTTYTPGELGMPLPDTISYIEKTRLVSHPKASPAKSMEMKSTAISDIQYLTVKHGLKYPWVECMLEDRSGTIW